MAAEYKIADAHAHIYPGKIAEKATKSVGDFYGLEMDRAGYPHALIESGARIGVKKYLVCSVATTPAQVPSINDFIAEKCKKYPSFLGFGALHPDFSDYGAEIERIRALGLRGVKFHPDFQRFNIDSGKMLPIYEKIAEAGLFVLFHTGDDRYDFSAPKRLISVARQLPQLNCIAAHFGGYNRWAEVRGYRGLDNVFFDSSSSLFKLPKNDARGVISELGAHRFMFGTDFPMWEHEGELARFLSLALSESDNRAILGENFERIFGVTL